MKKFLSLFAFALALIGGTAHAQSFASTPPEVVRYGANWVSTAAATANTAIAVVTAGQNVRGMIVWDIAGNSGTGVVTARGGYIANATAPTALSQGEMIVVGIDRHSMYASTHVLEFWMPRPVFISAGKGLFFIQDTTDATGIAIRRVLYTLL